VLKNDLVIFVDEEGMPRHPQALTLVLLGYFLGCPGDIPKLELFSMPHLIASFFSPYT
jgi:hypothetical protein